MRRISLIFVLCFLFSISLYSNQTLNQVYQPKLLKLVEGKSFNKAVHLQNNMARTITVWYWEECTLSQPDLYWWNENTQNWIKVSMNDGPQNWIYATITVPKLPVYVYFDSFWCDCDDNEGDWYWISDIDLDQNSNCWIFDRFIYSKNPEGQDYRWFSYDWYWYAYTVWGDEVYDLGENLYEFRGNVNIYGTADGDTWNPVLKYKFDKLIVSWDPTNARLKIVDGKFRLPSGYGLPYYIQEGRIRGVVFDVDNDKIVNGDNSITLTAFTPGNPSSTPEVNGIRASLQNDSRKIIVLKGYQYPSIKKIEMDYQGYIHSNSAVTDRVSITLGGITFTADFIEVDECGYYHLSGSITCSAGSFIFNDLEIYYNEQEQKITLLRGTLNVGTIEITIKNLVIDAQTGFVVIGGATLRIPEIKLPDVRIIDVVADFDWEGFHCRGRLENSTGMLYVEFDISPDGEISNIQAAGTITYSFENTTISCQWFADLGNNSYSASGNVTIDGILFTFDSINFTYNDSAHTISLKKAEIIFPNSIFASVRDVVYDLNTHQITFGQLTVGVEEFQIAQGVLAGLQGDFYPDHLHLYGRLNQQTVAFQASFDLSYTGEISNLFIGAQLTNLQFGNLIISAETWISPQAGVYIFSGNVQISGYGFTFNQLQITWNSSAHTIYINYAELKVPYFTGSVSGVLIDAYTGQILDGAGKVSLGPFNIGGYSIVSISANFDKYFIEVDGSIGIPELIQPVSGIKVHFKIDWKGNIYSIGGGVTGEIPIFETGISLYNPYIQVDNELGFIENGGLNRTGWVIILIGTIAPSGGGIYVIAEDFQLIIEPSNTRFTLNGILKLAGAPIANSTIMIEPGHLFSNVNSTVRFGGEGNFEIHGDAWVEIWWDKSYHLLKRSGAGKGYIAYKSHRVVNGDFTLDDEKLYGQAEVTILEDWLEFCLTWKLYNNFTLNITWGCQQLPPVANPCGLSDPLPSCPYNLIASVSSNKIKLTWDPATDDKGITYYRIYKNGSPYGVVYYTTLQFQDNDIEEGQIISYEVHSIDTVYQEQTACKGIQVIGGGSNIILYLNKTQNNGINLYWEGTNFPIYIVYKGNSPENLKELTRTGDNSFVDYSQSSGNLIYYAIQQRDL
ncbi:MAG: hypothetical protein WHV67_05995 [Thermoanaerobaculia bacterium]